MNIGNVISIMLTWSTKMPRKIRIAIISAMIMFFVRPCATMSNTMPLLAPENDKICENVVAPTMTNKIMPEIAVVPRNAARKFSRVSAP